MIRTTDPWRPCRRREQGPARPPIVAERFPICCRRTPADLTHRTPPLSLSVPVYERIRPALDFLIQMAEFRHLQWRSHQVRWAGEVEESLTEMLETRPGVEEATLDRGVHRRAKGCTVMVETWVPKEWAG